MLLCRLQVIAVDCSRHVVLLYNRGSRRGEAASFSGSAFPAIIRNHAFWNAQFQQEQRVRFIISVEGTPAIHAEDGQMRDAGGNVEA